MKAQTTASSLKRVPHVRNGKSTEDQTVSAYPTWKQLALRSLWLLLYPAALVTVNIMRSNQAFVERVYATGFFPPIRTAVGAFFSIFPFSFAEFLLYSLVAALIAFAVICIVLCAKHRLPLRRFVGWLLVILIIGGAGVNAFYWMWGLNYFRSTLAERLNIDTASIASTDDLRLLCLALADTANTLRAGLSEDETGVFVYDQGSREILTTIPEAYERLSEAEPVFEGTVFSAKPVFASELLSHAGIAGIFIPFTEEANVNMNGTPLLIASSAAHETAHYLGIAREEEANFAAFLACMASDDPQVQYSGIMLALIHAGNALANADQNAYAQLWAEYSDAVRRDLNANNEYVQSYAGAVSEASDRVNDRYLRANDQASGVQSYGEMVDLLIAYIKDRSRELD